jgi:hypothetical protein
VAAFLSCASQTQLIPARSSFRTLPATAPFQAGGPLVLRTPRMGRGRRYLRLARPVAIPPCKRQSLTDPVRRSSSSRSAGSQRRRLPPVRSHAADSDEMASGVGRQAQESRNVRAKGRPKAWCSPPATCHRRLASRSAFDRVERDASQDQCHQPPQRDSASQGPIAIVDGERGCNRPKPTARGSGETDASDTSGDLRAPARTRSA